MEQYNRAWRDPRSPPTPDTPLSIQVFKFDTTEESRTPTNGETTARSTFRCLNPSRLVVPTRFSQSFLRMRSIFSPNSQKSVNGKFSKGAETNRSSTSSRKGISSTSTSKSVFSPNSQSTVTGSFSANDETTRSASISRRSSSSTSTSKSVFSPNSQSTVTGSFSANDGTTRSATISRRSSSSTSTSSNNSVKDKREPGLSNSSHSLFKQGSPVEYPTLSPQVRLRNKKPIEVLIYFKIICIFSLLLIYIFFYEVESG